MWAVESPGVAPFVGFVGLAIPPFQAHFTPCVETGWRLAAEFWGRGYATEAARAAMGMTRSEADDFDHAAYLDDDRVRPHVLYRMSRAAWERKGAR